MDMEALRRQLPRPGAEFRSLPFYALNAHLQVDEVRRQTEDMLAHGMGGYFLHSREGLETEYMGEDWMEAIRAAVEAAKARGGQAWLYDEDRFPSGGAGGKVQSANRLPLAPEPLPWKSSGKAEIIPTRWLFSH